MKVLLLQTDTAWNAPQLNMLRAGELIDGSPSADLIILPEMFTTGYATDPSVAAEKDGTALEWMKRMAFSTGAAVTGSVAVGEGRLFYNRLFFVKPDGNITRYDKRHLFSFAGEDKTYTAGRDRVIVEWCGFRILVQICYDLRFPVFARNMGDYDMILYVANWPTVRIDAWESLLKARAIENLCYVAAVNRVGKDPYTSYSGGTYLFDFKGRKIAGAKENIEEAVLSETELEPLLEFRKKFPALDDADNFELNQDDHNSLTARKL